VDLAAGVGSGALLGWRTQHPDRSVQLWNDLRFGVWQTGTAAPSPLPPLLFWRGQDNDLTTLAPGQSATYQLELYLPTSASNTDQGLRATIDLVWHAQA